MEEVLDREQGYHVHIKQFDGPLDLLLFLIEKAEVDIREVFISEITSEFLSYLSELDELDMEQASSFISVAATLVYMKSRSLMPKPRREDEEEEEDPGEALIRQLREYKAFKEASKGLRELNESAKLLHSRLPMEYPLPPREIYLKDTTVDGLYNALLIALGRLPAEERDAPVRSIEADRFTIRACTGGIRKRLKESGGRLMFLEFVEGKCKLEIIVTFMSLLEMLRRGEIKLSQKRGFGDIEIHEAELISDDEDISYDDETD
ncbi:MAG: segregation/condensation protein A [Clostridiales bacterium]|nr:segregation/condensation protein A [Clostridiales bacterium]